MNKNILVLTLVAELLTCALAAISYSRAGEIENLGVPVKSVSIMGMVKGHDANNEEVLYFSCGQPGSRFFLLQVNPASGKSRQFDSPSGEGAHGLIVGPDECVYLGTWGNGLLLKFDPRQPETGVVALGKPASSESYIWQFAVGSDGRVYGCTYPQARLIRYDVKSFILEDLGRLDDREMYARSIAASRNGSLYIGIGTVRAQIVRFDPATGSRVSLLADDQRPPGTAMVGRAGDGEVYARIEGKAFHCDGDKLRSVTSVPAPDIVRLGDGTIPDEARAERGRLIYKLTRKDGQSFEQQADFQGVGIQIFSLSAGPEGNIYGSSILPLEIFKFVPARGDLSDLGTSNGAEVYSFATDGKLLYSCAYPGGYLSIYNPKEDWSFGEHARSNPRGVGKMGDGHLRPRAMIMGKDGRVYVGSLPPYGQVGGALGIYDPKQDKIVENYRNLVQDQGISALCEDENGMIFGGTSVEAGGGGKAVAKSCVAFAWDYSARKKLWEATPVSGDRDVAALTVAKGKLFGISRPSQTLFVVDTHTFRFLHRTRLNLGTVQESALAFYTPHDRIYGLAQNCIFKIDPDDFQVTAVERTKVSITSGFAVSSTGIYFGSKMNLMRRNW